MIRVYRAKDFLKKTEDMKTEEARHMKSEYIRAVFGPSSIV